MQELGGTTGGPERKHGEDVLYKALQHLPAFLWRADGTPLQLFFRRSPDITLKEIHEVAPHFSAVRVQTQFPF
jgi:hypothetical protein